MDREREREREGEREREMEKYGGMGGEQGGGWRVSYAAQRGKGDHRSAPLNPTCCSHTPISCFSEISQYECELCVCARVCEREALSLHTQ